ncbi:MAG: NfeD family protein [Terrimicrobiaceae bacterium]
MTPTNTIVVLSLVGFLLLASEVFVPGMILGILGALCLAGAITFSYIEFGAYVGTITLVCILGAAFVGFIGWMMAFPHTAIGRRLMLKQNLERGVGEKERPTQSLVGQTGRAITPLRPAGTALINGQKVDVVAESIFVPQDSPIVVVLQEGMRVVVRTNVS